jgi:MFS family permease
VLAPYGRVLRIPHVRWLVIASIVGRLPFGILGLAIILFVHDRTGSFATAGIVSAAFSLAAAAGSPVQGRLMDRLGQRQVLLTSAAIHAVGGTAFVALGLGGASIPAVTAAAILAGVGVPQLSAALRGLWAVLLDDERQLRAALALDAIVLESVFVGGPLLTGLLVAVASPASALVVGFVFATVGSLMFAAAPPSRATRGGPAPAGLLGPLASPGMRTMILGALGFGFGFGAIEVGLPAFGVEHGNASFGGLAIASLSLGSAVGGLVYGARPPRSVRRAYLLLFAAVPPAMALLAIPWSLAAMLLLAPIAGALIAPLTAAENEMAGIVTPPGTVTEAYTWIVTATITGVAIGTAASGALVDAHGWRSAILAGAAAAAVVIAAALVRRRTLVAPA